MTQANSNIRKQPRLSRMYLNFQVNVGQCRCMKVIAEANRKSLTSSISFCSFSQICGGIRLHNSLDRLPWKAPKCLPSPAWATILFLLPLMSPIGPTSPGQNLLFFHLERDSGELHLQKSSLWEGLAGLTNAHVCEDMDVIENNQTKLPRLLQSSALIIQQELRNSKSTASNT